MNKISITRKLWFCAGHRVLNHESKCANLHGHNYIIYVKARADELDQLGRVIDFSVLKQKLDSWIQDKLDHTFIIFKDDHETLDLFSKGYFKQNKDVYIMETNPTAENIAYHLINDIFPKLLNGTNIKVTEVKLYETENNYAEVINE